MAGEGPASRGRRSGASSARTAVFWLVMLASALDLPLGAQHTVYRPAPLRPVTGVISSPSPVPVPDENAPDTLIRYPGQTMYINKYGERIVVDPPLVPLAPPSPPTPGPSPSRSAPAPEPEPSPSPRGPAASPTPAPVPEPEDPDDLPGDAELEARLKEEIYAVADLEAGIVLYDLKGGRKATVNPRIGLYPSSVVKLAIMVGALDAVATGKLSWDVRYPVTRVAPGLAPGDDRAPVPELLERMIVQGDHAAANTLFDLVGAEQLTRHAASLGLTDTAVCRKFNAPVATRTPPNRMSPADAAHLLYLIVRKDLPDPLASRKALDLLGRQTKTSGIPRFLAKLPGVHVFNLPGGARMKDGEELSCDAAIVTGPQHAYVLVAYTLARQDQTGWIAQVAHKVHRWLASPK
ncbi:MAG: serine hydrolase [Candidatus Riflebacteria bacterium]|nr:serine hydrolase [Candidatus Riflebacteria bacterium]